LHELLYLSYNKGPIYSKNKGLKTIEFIEQINITQAITNTKSSDGGWASAADFLLPCIYQPTAKQPPSFH